MYGKYMCFNFVLFFLLFPDHCLLIPRTIRWLIVPAPTAHVPSGLLSLLSPGGALVHQHPQPVHLPHCRIPHGAPACPGLLPSIHAPPTSHYAASLIPKDSIGGVVHRLSTHYQQHYPAHPYVTTSTSTTRGSGAYNSYQLSPRRVPQYPYI